MSNTTLNNLNDLRRKYTAQFGVPDDRVELVILDLEILNRLGTFVRVYAGGLTLFVKRASWQELGIPEESARKLRYKTSPKYLIDPSEIDWFRNAAQRARDNLEAVSVDVGFMHPYRWVGYKDWSEWLTNFQVIQAEWGRKRQQIIDNYNVYLQHIVVAFTQTANEAYEALVAAGVDNLPPREEFADRIVGNAIALMPSPRAIEQRLVLEYIIPAVITPAMLEKELLEAARIRQQREMEEEQARQRIQMEREMAEIQRQIELDARQEEMFRQRLEQYRHQAESLQAPLEQVLDQLYREIEETSRAVLNVLETHGSLRGRSGERLRALAQRVQMLEDLGQSRLLEVVRQAGALTEGVDDETEKQAAARSSALQVILHQINSLVTAEDRARKTLGLVAREMGRRTWRSICLNCRYVWQSTGSLEPALCPRCNSNRVVSREIDSTDKE